MAANLKVKAKRTAERRAFAEKLGAEFIAGLDEMLATAKSGGIKALKAKYASRVAATLPYHLQMSVRPMWPPPAPHSGSIQRSLH